MQRAAGFTLIETLIVVALAAVMAAISVPQVVAGMERYYINSAGQQVVSTIRAARFQAVTRNEILEVQFDLDAGEYQVFEDGGVTPVGGVQQLPTDISFAAGSAAMVEINTNGRVTTAANITVTNGNAEEDRTITVTTSGRVQLQ
jgi:prepilin-type N-terminal cleavage/methylation domain-containing protein